MPVTPEYGAPTDDVPAVITSERLDKSRLAPSVKPAHAILTGDLTVGLA